MCAIWRMLTELQILKASYRVLDLHCKMFGTLSDKRWWHLKFYTSTKMCLSFRPKHFSFKYQLFCCESLFWRQKLWSLMKFLLWGGFNTFCIWHISLYTCYIAISLRDQDRILLRFLSYSIYFMVYFIAYNVRCTLLGKWEMSIYWWIMLVKVLYFSLSLFPYIAFKVRSGD